VDSNVLVDKEIVGFNKNERSPVFSGLLFSITLTNIKL